VVAGHYHICARNSKKELKCWGKGFNDNKIKISRAIKTKIL
jgi:hypothetical protein